MNDYEVTDEVRGYWVEVGMDVASRIAIDDVDETTRIVFESMVEDGFDEKVARSFSSDVAQIVFEL